MITYIYSYLVIIISIIMFSSLITIIESAVEAGAAVRVAVVGAAVGAGGGVVVVMRATRPGQATGAAAMATAAGACITRSRAKIPFIYTCKHRLVYVMSCVCVVWGVVLVRIGGLDVCLGPG